MHSRRQVLSEGRLNQICLAGRQRCRIRAEVHFQRPAAVIDEHQPLAGPHHCTARIGDVRHKVDYNRLPCRLAANASRWLLGVGRASACKTTAGGRVAGIGLVAGWPIPGNPQATDATRQTPSTNNRLRPIRPGVRR